MGRLATILGALVGCSYHPPSDLQPPGDDAAIDGAIDASPDAFVGPLPSACVQKWLDGTVTLANPALLPGNFNSIDDERNPSLSKDELILYFSSINGADDDTFNVVRTSTAAAFNTATLKSSLTFLGNEGRLTMTDDELTVFIASTRVGGEGGFDIWEAHRGVAGTGAFDPPTTTNTQAINAGGDQTDPQISPDGLRLYYADGDPQKILQASRSDVGAPFTAGVELANIDDPAVDDADPALTADERVLVFSSARTGAGSNDLWYATRAERDRPFGTPVAVPAVNGTDSDRDAFISPDGCKVFFATDRLGDFDIFFSTVQ